MRGALTLLYLLPLLLPGQALLRVRAIDNGGAARKAGARSAGLTVEVTDELGKPVPTAVVNVRLPDDGPSGSFANGLSSVILTTGADGRAGTTPISWNRLPGTAEIRITAVSGRLRAGTIATCRLSDPEPEPDKPAVTASEPEKHGPRVIVKPHASSGGGHLKWILIGAAAAGASAATLGLRRSGSTTSSGSTGGGSGIVTSITALGAPTVGAHP
jgi:hypothetical protein